MMNTIEPAKFWKTPVTGEIAFDRASPAAARDDGDRDLMLRSTLKRCSEATLIAACEFWRTGRTAYLPTIVIGVIERFVEKDLRPKLASPTDNLRLVEDLGIDSLTMMEIVLLAEEVLPISINNEDLRDLRTLGELQQFVDQKLRGFSVPIPDFVETKN